MTETVYTRLPRSRVLEILQGIPRVATETPLVAEKAGVAVLNRTHLAFLIKSRGGTDECGERWAPLAKATIVKRLRKLRPTREQDRPSSALSPAQKDKWWGWYRGALARYHDKGIAAKIAWTQLKKYGGSAHYDKYGSTSLGILRDTEELLNSLRPDAPSNVFRTKSGEAEVGTNRKGAAAHHKGAKNLPQRRLWPPPSRWTSAWWQEVLRSARVGVMQLIIEKLR